MMLDQDQILDILDMARYNEIYDLQVLLNTLLKDGVGIQDIVDEDSGNTPLHMAAANGHLQIIQCLVDGVKDLSMRTQYINFKNKGGNAALHWACMNGHASVVEFLLKNNADADAKNNYDRSALYYAFQCGKEDVKDLILQSIKMENEEECPESVEEIKEEEEDVNEVVR
ncbi:hypothetical protein MIR68_012318 [Amoeboaphelidium protococcarum]|nr:hypothetical protein MIR68_012318 [Amoeboaphelidium protococcarum]KAI3652868.1 hypothetical protein MP228_002293 [Amoeboaphelidium protococcarum]